MWSNLPGLWRWIGWRGTRVLPLQSLHGGAGPTATQYWRTLGGARDSGRSYATRAGILEQDCVLLQARNHKKHGKRSGNTANEQPRTLGLEGQCSKRYVCLCAREWVCERVCECVHAGRENDPLDGGTQMRINCRAWTPNPLTARLRGRGSRDKDSYGDGSSRSEQAPSEDCSRGTGEVLVS